MRFRGEAGFSMPEVLVGVVVLGLLAGLAGWKGQGVLARQRVEVAARELVVAIERQRDLALRDGRARSLAVEGPGGLLEAARGAGGTLDLRHNLPPQLRVTANGLLLDGGTVVVGSAAADLRRCLVMALPIGVLRLGRYGGDAGGPVSAEACRRDEAA